MDLINRQSAIDVVDSETVSTNPEHFKSSEKFINFMDDSDISSFGKWQWSNGFNTALTAVRIDLKKLPSAQPEIIRCKDCKHYHTDVLGQELGIEGLYGHIIVAHNACDRWSEHMNSVDPDGFCFLAERRTDD